MATMPDRRDAGAPDARTAADLAVFGAQIRTLDPSRPFATAVAVRDGTILAVGADAEVRLACGHRTEMIDGTGLAVAPGLVDSHMHPLWAADLAVGVDAAGMSYVESYVLPCGASAWVRRRSCGPGASTTRSSRANAWTGAFLEKLADGPALIIFFDLHTYLATHSVLEMVGVTGEEDFAGASEFVTRDGR